MAAYEHSTNDGVKVGPGRMAKKKALGDLKDVMNSLESKKLPKAGEESAVTVTRKVAHSSSGSTDFKGGKGPSSAPAKPLKQVEKVAAPKTPQDDESVAEDAYEGGEEEEIAEQERADGEKTHKADRANPGDLGDAKEIDRALKAFLVKGKKHIRKG